MPTDLTSAFESLWREEPPPDVFGYLAQHPDLSNEAAVSVLLVDQRYRWKSSQPIQVEEYLQRVPKLANDESSQFDLLAGEFRARNLSAEESNLSEYESRFPELTPSLRQQLLACLESSENVAAGGPRAEEDSAVESESDILSMFPVTSDPSIPPVSQDKTRLMGRYRRVRILGQGAFGRVYLGFDEELHRQVAIKVPTKEALLGEQNSEQYLSEARMVASLEHPHIVPVYDVGRTEDYPVYVVSRYIQGSTLAERIEQGPIAPAEAAELVATIAEALDYAHSRRLIHRDVKPANILLEEDSQKAFITDFGLAIREEDYLRDGRLAGTPAYMSPEQARGEGHRLDGRSDLFSLGIIFYELLTGTRPFEGDTSVETLYQVISATPVPPRQRCPDLPPELERICLRCLEKRAAARYATALELAEELHAWNVRPIHAEPRESEKIIPKGLRSFDADDSRYFLDLLPGPRNREGYPTSLQFWRNRFTQRDNDKTFPIGIVYGPSGCGKSSLVKAGLIPSLPKEVEVIYIVATGDHTEEQIRRELTKRFPDLPESLELSEALQSIRYHSSNKLVLVIDQFEQWLHHHSGVEASTLVAALRQCDGGTLQSLLLVRDDFALATARFMEAVETPIVQGENFEVIDLFDVDHARKLLLMFGQAYGRLPEDESMFTQDQNDFLDAVTDAIAVDGKVISVRLTLFVEIVKSRVWSIQTWEEVGGTDGMGLRFLEETFTSKSTNPRYRKHERAARQVLEALLPNSSVQLKGQSKSWEALSKASGYSANSPDFQDLLTILDTELRLVTPVEVMESTTTSGSLETNHNQERHFQLSHDYMVEPLREWVHQKRRASYRGRAFIRLAEKAEGWSRKRGTHFLPSSPEYLYLRCLTRRSEWTQTQRDYLRAAFRRTCRRGLLLAVASVLLMGGWKWLDDYNRIYSYYDPFDEPFGDSFYYFRDDPLTLPPESFYLESITATVHHRTATQCRQVLRQGNRRSRLKAHFYLMTYHDEAGHLVPMVEELLQDYTVEAATFVAIAVNVYASRHPDSPEVTEAVEKVQRVLNEDNWISSPKLAATYWFLACLDPKWLSEGGPHIIDWIQKNYSADSGGMPDPEIWSIHEHEISHAAKQSRESFRKAAVNQVIRLGRPSGASARPVNYDLRQQRLLRFLGRHYWPSRIADEAEAVEILTNLGPLSVKNLELSSRELDLVENAIRQRSHMPGLDNGSFIATGLVKLLEAERFGSVIDLLQELENPDAVSQWLWSYGRRGIEFDDVFQLFQRLDERRRSQPKVRSAASDQAMATVLVLMSNSFFGVDLGENKLPIRRLKELYAQDPSSLIHSSCRMVLEALDAKYVMQFDSTPLPYDTTGVREWFIESVPIQASENVESPSTETLYFTFVVFEPGSFQMGPREMEAPTSWGKGHEETIARRFAISDRELTLPQWNAMAQGKGNVIEQFKSRFDSIENLLDLNNDPPYPASGVTWLEAVDYCRWLTTQANWGDDEQCFTPAMGEDANDKGNEWVFDASRHGFRLPTEAEWEYAYRSSIKTPFHYGSDPELQFGYGWQGVSFLPPEQRQRELTKPTRSDLPNPRGLFDMIGNVTEWCGANQLNPESGLHATRGSQGAEEDARAGRAIQRSDRGAERHPGQGFRLVLTLPQ